MRPTTAVEIDKAVGSLARFIAGLPPRRGSTHFFLRHASPESLPRLLNLRSGKRCPFCGREFRRASGFVYHLLRVHRAELEAALYGR